MWHGVIEVFMKDVEMIDCPFCNIEDKPDENIVLSNDYCVFIQQPQEVLIGSGLIVPRKHRETVFDLTKEEWNATYDLLIEVKVLLDQLYNPQGYNLGWNVGRIGGQEIFHAHLHVIPRFEDEPYAGRGIRYWLKQKENKRNK
jgi:diadenosine tetraphosphate (Ap4A) HIT family hydrolase